jgi:hypothetical protein
MPFLLVTSYRSKLIKKIICFITNNILITNITHIQLFITFGKNKLNYWDSLAQGMFCKAIINGRAQVIQELHNLRTIKEELAKKINKFLMKEKKFFFGVNH